MIKWSKAVIQSNKSGIFDPHKADILLVSKIPQRTTGKWYYKQLSQMGGGEYGCTYLCSELWCLTDICLYGGNGSSKPQQMLQKQRSVSIQTTHWGAVQIPPPCDQALVHRGYSIHTTPQFKGWLDYHRNWSCFRDWLRVSQVYFGKRALSETSLLWEYLAPRDKVETQEVPSVIHLHHDRETQKERRDWKMVSHQSSPWPRTHCQNPYFIVGGIPYTTMQIKGPISADN